MFEITDAAKDKLKEVLDGNPGKFLRVMIQGVGWGGPQLGLALDEPQDNETAIEINGIDVLISSDVRSFTDGNKLDYVTSQYGEGFTISGGSSCCWYFNLVVASSSLVIID